MLLVLALWFFARVSGESAAKPAKKGTGALQGVKPTRRSAPKTELISATRETKVSQATIDSMKQMGMTKAIAKANSGNASAEFVEGAKRMYGDRVKAPIASSPTVTKTAAKNSTPGPVVAERQRMQAKAKADAKKSNIPGKGRATGLR